MPPIRLSFFLYPMLLMALVTAACTQSDDGATETPEPPPQPTVAATETSSQTPSATAPLGTPSPTFPPTLTPTLTGTPAPPTQTPLPTDTPGPFEHTIRENEDCISIVYTYGHVDLDVLQEFYALNNMNGCILPSVGGVVLVPRPTIPPDAAPQVQEDTEPTATAFRPSIYQNFTEYCVEEGDTLTSIALKNNTSLRRICELNPLPDGLDCRGCDFSESDVGFCPNPPLISVGDCVTVPGPTPFPTPTAPPTGDETATPTPTHRAPDVIYPQNGVVSGILRLQWVSVGHLSEGERYVVHLTDETTGALFINATQSTFMDVPLEYVPSDGQPHQMTWYVSIEAQNESGLFVAVGGRTPDYRFVWE